MQGRGENWEPWFPGTLGHQFPVKEGPSEKNQRLDANLSLAKLLSSGPRLMIEEI